MQPVCNDAKPVLAGCEEPRRVVNSPDFSEHMRMRMSKLFADREPDAGILRRVRYDVVLQWRVRICANKVVAGVRISTLLPTIRPQDTRQSTSAQQINQLEGLAAPDFACQPRERITSNQASRSAGLTPVRPFAVR